MKQKRSGFLTFWISMIPGAGQMFLGFFKEGVSLMTLFFGICGLASWLYIDALYFFNVIVWIYAFFDALNKNSMPDEQFAQMEDHYLFIDSMEDFKGFSISKHRKWVAVGLIVIGLYLLGNNIISMMASFGFAISYELHRLLTRYLPQMIVSIVIIAIGIRLMAGKYSDVDNIEEEKYLDGGDGE